MTASAGVTPSACGATCTPTVHRYDKGHPWPHAAELASHVADAEPATADIPRQTDTLPVDVAVPTRPKMTVDADTLDQLAERAVSLCRDELEAAAFRDAVCALVGWPQRGALPEPPVGFCWAVVLDTHSLPGSHGPAHLLPATPDRNLYGHPIRAFCGKEAITWLTIGRWETREHVPCHQCSMTRVRS